ncbi:hypothetical protein OSTOST_05046 [Ostertagia ostertagi]
MRLPQPGEALSAGQAATFPALRLFVERAKAAAPGFALTDADVPQLVALCTRLDGIPLAIEIVAARVDSLGIAGLSDQLESLLLHLPVRRRHAPARHSTLAALLEWSYRLLSPVEQTVLRRLSVFRSGFSAEVAEQVVGDAEIGDDDVQETLLDLMAKSLVAPGRGGDPALRRLLDTTRSYAGHKLDEAGERQAVSLRHARWLAGVLAEAESAWNLMTRQQWMTRYSPLIDDIRAALDWAFTPDGDVALGMDLTIAGFAIGRQMLLVDEFTDRVKRAIDAITAHGDGPGPALDPADADARRKRLTFLIACLGLASDAALTPTLETAATSLTGADQLLQRFAGCNGMWATAVFRGDFKDGGAWADRMEQLADAIGDPVARLVSGRIQAQTLHFAGRHSLAAEKARGVLGESWRTIPLSYNPSPVELRVSMRVMLARTLWMQGRPDSAAAMAEEAIEQALTDSPLAHCQVIVMGSLVIAMWSGLAAPARELAGQLVDLEKLLGFSHWLRWSRGLRAMVALREGGDVPAIADASWFEEPEPVLADHLATLDDRWLTPRCIQRVESGMRQARQTVERLTGFDRGEPYTEQQLADFQERLAKTQLFDAVRVQLQPEVVEADGTSPVLVTLTESSLQQATVAPRPARRRTGAQLPPAARPEAQPRLAAVRAGPQRRQDRHQPRPARGAAVRVPPRRAADLCRTAARSRDGGQPGQHQPRRVHQPAVDTPPAGQHAAADRRPPGPAARGPGPGAGRRHGRQRAVRPHAAQARRLQAVRRLVRLGTRRGGPGHRTRAGRRAGEAALPGRRR